MVRVSGVYRDFFFHFLMRPMRCPEAKKTYAFAPRQLLKEEGMRLPCPMLFWDA